MRGHVSETNDPFAFPGGAWCTPTWQQELLGSNSGLCSALRRICLVWFDLDDYPSCSEPEEIIHLERGSRTLSEQTPVAALVFLSFVFPTKDIRVGLKLFELNSLQL